MSYKIAIVNPKARHMLNTNEPLNILVIAAYLKQEGINIRIIDEHSGDDVIKEVKDFKPDLVGFTATTCPYPRAVQLMKTVKLMGYKTIIGGVHASTLPEKAKEDGFDMVVVGEGEKMLVDIIKKGEKEGIYRVSREAILKSEEIPLPDRTLINMEFYCTVKDRSPYDVNLDFVPEGARMASFLTSRGCPFNCIFCHNDWRGLPVRGVAPEMIIEELERLVRDYHTHFVLFVDDDFFWKKNRALRFCELVIQKKLPISWATSTRPDSVDDELLRIASQAGCKRLAFGFESGSQRVLNVLKKRSDIGVNLAAAQVCHKYNIDVLGLFMVGNPTETKKDLQLTWEFIKKAKVDSLSVSVLTPFPGTQLWKQCEERGYIKPDIDFSTFYFTYGTVQIPDTFPPRIVEKFKRQLLIKACLFNPKIRKRFLCRVCKHPIVTFNKVLDYMPFLRKIPPSALPSP